MCVCVCVFVFLGLEFVVVFVDVFLMGVSSVVKNMRNMGIVMYCKGCGS